MPPASTAMKSVVVDPAAYDWEGDRPLRLPSSQSIVYEMHVRGFTRHPSSGLPDDARGPRPAALDAGKGSKNLILTMKRVTPKK